MTNNVLYVDRNWCPTILSNLHDIISIEKQIHTSTKNGPCMVFTVFSKTLRPICIQYNVIAIIYSLTNFGFYDTHMLTVTK